MRNASEGFVKDVVNSEVLEDSELIGPEVLAQEEFKKHSMFTLWDSLGERARSILMEAPMNKGNSKVTTN